MHKFRYVRGGLHCEGVSVRSIARRYGPPVYIYSAGTMVENYRRFAKAFEPLNIGVCYAVKANSNLGVLAELGRAGAGFDVVSGGELRRVAAAGGNVQRCVFAGVGKAEWEIEEALRRGIFSFHVESEPELERIARLARRLKIAASVALRVNPDVAAGGHEKITTGASYNKFGIPFEKIEPLYEAWSKNKWIRLRGIQMHIGSQIARVEPFLEAIRKIAPLAGRLRERFHIEYFSVGGGLGIPYEDALASGEPEWWKKKPGRDWITPEKYAAAVKPLLEPLGLRIFFEPGRWLVGPAGVLVTKVEYVKETPAKRFVIVDAGMTDLLRPALYDAYHEIVPVIPRKGPRIRADVVGPVCESGDVFAKDRELPEVAEGDLLAVMSAGAYGAVMASNYNSRPLPAEVMVKGRRVELLRPRQSIEDLWRRERVPD